MTEKVFTIQVIIPKYISVSGLSIITGDPPTVQFDEVKPLHLTLLCTPGLSNSAIIMIMSPFMNIGLSATIQNGGGLISDLAASLLGQYLPFPGCPLQCNFEINLTILIAITQTLNEHR